MIRVVVADDNPVLRLGIRDYLDACEDIEVVAEAGDGAVALDRVREHRPDVLILDVRMPEMDGITVLERLQEPVAVLVLTNSDDLEVIHAALSRGATGYLVYPPEDLGEIARAVRQVARGETVLAPRAASRLLTLLPDAAAAAPESSDRAEEAARRFHLSSREVEVLELLARGCSNAEIAGHLYIAEKTVKNHLNRIFAKLGASNRAEAMAIWRGDREPGDRGQVMPVYLTAVVASVALTLALVQIGSAHVLERRSETAADAAALAAAGRIGRGLAVGVGGIDPGVGAGALSAAASELADENGAELVDLDVDRFDPRGWRVSATVETRDGVIGGPVDAVIGRRARTTSTASLTVEVEALPPSLGGSSLRELAGRAGVPFPLSPTSALVRHAGETCQGGVDTDRLSDEVKIAILQVEAALGQGLQLAGGYASPVCLLAGGAVVPELSPATRGDQIRLSPGQPLAEALLRDRGFCQDGDTFIAPGNLACGGDLSSLVTTDTRLVPNP